MSKLPRDVSAYLDKALKGLDWQRIDTALPDVCNHCPQYTRPVNDAAPVCWSCPWWSVLYAHLSAQHWHGHQHLRRITSLQEDGRGRD